MPPVGRKGVSGGTRAAAICALVAAVCLLGCAEADPPENGVALKQGGELAAWAPGGKTLAAPGIDKINLVGLDGEVERQIAVPGVRSATWPCACRLGWSDRGGEVLFVTGRGPHRGGDMVGSVDLHGGAPRTRPLEVSVGDAGWSPRGWPLVFVADNRSWRSHASSQLWRLDGLGASPRTIHTQSGELLRPQFSPDGSEILYLRNKGGWRSTWIVNADGSQPHQVARPLWLGVAGWAPDGKRIVVAGQPRSGSADRLYIASTAGGKLRPLRRSAGFLTSVAWSPDGRWIAYSRLDGEIWHLRPDGTGAARIGDIPGHDVRRLLWSPDGRHLAYVARRLDESD